MFFLLGVFFWEMSDEVTGLMKTDDSINVYSLNHVVKEKQTNLNIRAAHQNWTGGFFFYFNHEYSHKHWVQSGSQCLNAQTACKRNKLGSHQTSWVPKTGFPKTMSVSWHHHLYHFLCLFTLNVPSEETSAVCETVIITKFKGIKNVC